MRDYFDVLPIHHQPEPLESFASYLIRLAEANGCNSAQGFLHLLFPKSFASPQTYLRGYPLASFEHIAMLAGCAEDQLRATTFFYLGQRFGWPAEIRLHPFLWDCLVPHLRYCPDCLANRPYYSLAWRFRWLEGCPLHGGRLLDCCGHCQHMARVFEPPLRIGLCPACHRRYRHCAAEALDTVSLARARSRWQDLEYLLTPGWQKPSDLPVAQQIGYQFVSQRHARRLSLQEVAGLTNLPILKLKYIEQGNQRGLRLQDYLACAEGLGLPLRDILVTPVSLVNLEGAYQDQIKGAAVTAHQARARVVQVEPPRLLPKQTLGQIEAAMWGEAMQIVEALSRQEASISLRQVARRLKVSVFRLKASPVRARLVQHLEAARHRQRALRMFKKRDVLAEQVSQAVAELKGRQQPITRRALLAATGIPAWQFDLYPSLRQFYWGTSSRG